MSRMDTDVIASLWRPSVQSVSSVVNALLHPSGDAFRKSQGYFAGASFTGTDCSNPIVAQPLAK